MKKRLLLALTAAFFITGLSACTGGKQESGSDNTDGAAAAEFAEENAKPAVKEFTVGKGNVGLVTIGMEASKMPKQVEGLYDKFEKKTEEFEDNEETWTEEYFLCTKAGKPVLKANLSEDRLVSITLLEGSSNVKTPDGIYVGYPARELFQKKKMEWENWYEGYVFASDGTYCYSVDSNDLVDVDTPEKASDFKADAKVCKITLNNE